MSKRWSIEEDELLKKLWWELPRKQVFATMSDRTPKAITKRVLFLGLSRSGEAAKKMQRKWSPSEIDALRELWWSHTPKEVFTLLPEFTASSIVGKARKLKLPRSPETAQRLLENKRQLLVHRNTTVLGRERNYENARKAASTYTNSTEFYRKDSSMYQFIKRNGWWDELCSHMVIGNYNYSESFLFECVRFLFPGQEVLRNTRKVISPYELDIYVPCAQVAFEYDGSNWHNDPEVCRRDAIKSKLCAEKGIILHRIREVRAERSQPESSIVDALSLIGYDVSGIDLDCCIKAAFESGYSDATIRARINKYTALKDFRGNEPYLYGLLLRRGLAAKYTKLLKRENNTYTPKEISEALTSATSAAEFRAAHWGMYQYMQRRPTVFSEQLEVYRKLRAYKYDGDNKRIG